MEFPITSSSTSCFHCREKTCTQTRKQKTGFQCIMPFQHCRCQGTHTCTHTRYPRGKMRGCFSPGCLEGKEKCARQNNGCRGGTRAPSAGCWEAAALSSRLPGRQTTGEMWAKPMRGDTSERKLGLLNVSLSAYFIFTKKKWKTKWHTDRSLSNTSWVHTWHVTDIIWAMPLHDNSWLSHWEQRLKWQMTKSAITLEVAKRAHTPKSQRVVHKRSPL